MTPLVFSVRVRLLSADLGGRNWPVISDYRPRWNLGNTWLGEPTLNEGRLVLAGCSEIEPGKEGLAHLEPLAPEFWGAVHVGSVITMQEGKHVVGDATILHIASQPEHFTPEVLVFVNQARQFCDFIEKAGKLSLSARLSSARQRLLDVYRAAAALPHVEPPEGVEAGASPPRPANWVEFEKFELYSKVFDPYVRETPVTGALSDDLLDVYGDLRRGLDLWDQDVPKSAAIWEWRCHFDTHWGDHAIDALRALHRACREARRE
jgi:Domain of unknown function (DUF5063)